MSKRKFALPALAGVLSLALLTACKPADPPPDIIKAQREALEKAKAVKDVQDKAVQEQLKSINQQTKAADEQAGQGDSSGK